MTTWRLNLHRYKKKVGREREEELGPFLQKIFTNLCLIGSKYIVLHAGLIHNENNQREVVLGVQPFIVDHDFLVHMFIYIFSVFLP
jgi:hypothetical protein